MIIQTFPSGPFETNAYIVACKETRKAAIIDPAPNSADAIIGFLSERNLRPKMILITHSHWDHIGDTAQLKVKFHTPIYIHALDVPNLKNPGSDGLPYWGEIEGVLPDKNSTYGYTRTRGESSPGRPNRMSAKEPCRLDGKDLSLMDQAIRAFLRLTTFC